MGYSINYREYKDKEQIADYKSTACFSKIFDSGIDKNTTQILLYIKDLFVTDEEFIAWVAAVNNAGFPCKYEGKGGDKGLEWVKLSNIYHIVTVPTGQYNENIMYLTSALSIIRAAYDQSGHMGKDPHKIVQNYFKIKAKLNNIDEFTAIMMAHAMYGRGAGHLIHDSHKLRKFTLKELLDTPNGKTKNIYSGGRYLHVTYNDFATFENDPTKMSAKEYYAAIEDKPLKKKVTKVYVVGGENNYANWLPNTKIVKSFDNADLILFTGGEDVTPKYYGEPKHPATHCNEERDKREAEIFKKAKQAGKKMLGICRGSQFLCVMNGGKLVQHQENTRYIHKINVTFGDYKDRIILITSTHHQAQYPYNLPKWDYKIIGWTNGTSDIHQDGNEKELNPEKECEIVYYKKTKSLGIQGHPEHVNYQTNNKESMGVLYDLFNNFINDKL